MKKLIPSYFIAFSFWLFSTPTFCQSISKYGVEVIDEWKVYKKQVRANPIMKLVDLKNIDGIYFDIKYATDNNFTKEKIYATPDAYARELVAQALTRANKAFAEKGLAIKIFDAYRPYSATVKFYEIYKDTSFVASPYSGSRHNRGCAIDLTLVDRETGEELPMPTKYDDFSDRAHPSFEKLPHNKKSNRDLLIATMKEFGFNVYPTEWWHFDYFGWEEYPLMDLTFEELKK